MSKSEKIFIQDNDVVIELTGKDKEEFITNRNAENEAETIKLQELEAQKQLKIDAYKKLGLTDEEIAAII